MDRFERFQKMAKDEFDLIVIKRNESKSCDLDSLKQAIFDGMGIPLNLIENQNRSSNQMIILKSYTNKRYGNECLLTEAISLIQVTPEYYIVLHAKHFKGSWIHVDSSYDTRYSVFCRMGDANAHFDRLYNDMKKD